MTFRTDLIRLLTGEARSVSSLAREFGLRRADVEEALGHAIRSARAAGHGVEILPARCRACGFTFDQHRLSKPGKCPACRSTRLYEPQVLIRPGPDG